MTQDWHQFFPYPSFRKCQENAINLALKAFFADNKKFCVLDLPTGAGKSAIGSTIGSHFSNIENENGYENGYYYITSQKILQSQLDEDFGEHGKWSNPSTKMIELKGRNAYPCIFYEKILNDPQEKQAFNDLELARFAATKDANCATGECKKKGKGKLKYCEDFCPYHIQLNKALDNKAVLMNFHAFIFQTQMTDRWSRKSLLIIDEGHDTEQVLLDYVTIEFHDKIFGVKFPKFENAEEYLIYFEDIKLFEIVQEKLKQADEANDDKEAEKWGRMFHKLKIFKESIINYNTEWIVKYEDKLEWRSLSFKPLFVSKFAKELLFDFCDKVLIMSATILNKHIFCSSLGINEDNCFYHAAENQFPVANRQVTYKPSGSMSFKNKQETMPKMIDDVNEICRKHSTERGIIHTNSFDISEKLLNNCSLDVKRRFFYQKNFTDKEQMLEEHSKSSNGILIGPALHIGLDLKDDLSRFQIICKVPYPSFADNPQLKRRMEISGEYYMFLTAMKLVQSIGRSIRSETDWAKTYVLDSDFKSFCARSRGILPNWFIKSIIW